MAKTKKMNIVVTVDEHDRVIIAVYDRDDHGEYVCIRESVLDLSSALQLGFSLQRACEDIMKKKAGAVEERIGRKVADVKVGRH